MAWARSQTAIPSKKQTKQKQNLPPSLGCGGGWFGSPSVIVWVLTGRILRRGGLSVSGAANKYRARDVESWRMVRRNFVRRLGRFLCASLFLKHGWRFLRPRGTLYKILPCGKAKRRRGAFPLFVRTALKSGCACRCCLLCSSCLLFYGLTWKK